MRILSGNDAHGEPERAVARLVAQLRNHAALDSLLLFSPPLLVVLYIASYLYRLTWISPLTFMIAAAAGIGIGLLAVALRYRPSAPSASKASRLIDEQAGAKDRFLTLTTIDPARSPVSLLARLRAEAGGCLDRVEIKRDFPYRIKRGFYGSLIGSVLGALLFHLLLPVALSTLHPVAPSQRLREIAEKMAARPSLSAIAGGIRTLATKLEEPKAGDEEKPALVEKLRQQVEEQQNKEQRKEDHDLLSQAAGTLKSLEPQAGAGQEQRQEKGGGGIQSNLPQEGRGEEKPSPGSGGDQKGEMGAQLGKEMEKGKSAGGDPKGPGGEKNQRSSGDGKGDQPDPNRPGSDQSREAGGKKAGGSDERGGRGKASEEIPQGGPPAERFYQTGEQGHGSIKGGRYVTVQLPEEVAADGKSEKGGGHDAKGARVGAKVPVSNVPLPAHVPDAPAEKQQMPLEYRGVIR